MATFVPYNRDQSFLLPPDLKDWLPADDLAHFVVAAVERLPLAAFPVNPQAGGKPQYDPRLMLALLIYCYANGLFSSRRIERATHRDLGVRFVVAKGFKPSALRISAAYRRDQIVTSMYWDRRLRVPASILTCDMNALATPPGLFAFRPSANARIAVSGAYGPLASADGSDRFFVSAQHQGISSSMRSLGQPLTKRVSRSVK
jgi:hypothetical protein